MRLDPICLALRTSAEHGSLILIQLTCGEAFPNMGSLHRLEFWILSRIDLKIRGSEAVCGAVPLTQTYKLECLYELVPLEDSLAMTKLYALGNAFCPFI